MFECFQFAENFCPSLTSKVYEKRLQQWKKILRNKLTFALRVF